MKVTHGHSRTKTYAVWLQMRYRCHAKTSPDWKRYGGRGITVCERWEKFENFLADMGTAPTGRCLDRIDNDLGYSKENCRWATRSGSTMNRRFVGIHWHKPSRKWAVRIQHNRKPEYLGLFSSREKAIAVRRAAEREFFGEYAPVRSA